MDSPLAAKVDAVDTIFDASVFSLDVVKKAAYAISASATTEITLDGQTIRCTLRFSSPVSVEEANQRETHFRLEVLDQDLRERISEETAPLRNAILAHAFSGTGFQK